MMSSKLGRLTADGRTVLARIRIEALVLGIVCLIRAFR